MTKKPLDLQLCCEYRKLQRCQLSRKTVPIIAPRYKYKYPPDQQEDAVNVVLQQAEALGEAWV